ncbi:MAG: histidine phosphatase family protein [Chloroflexi bacterium]|nr:histidine phosphatase family protein [Chloroflexota bacterium]
MELYLIRHGQSTNNALEDDTERSHDPILTKLGYQQSILLSEFIATAPRRDPLMSAATGYSRYDDEEPTGVKLTDLLVSPMYRALQTALPISQALDLPAVVRYDIFEHGGLYLEKGSVVTPYPGKTRKAVLKEFPRFILRDLHADHGWYDIRLGRESYGQACGRAITLAVELRERAAGRDRDARIGMVTHGTFLDMLLKALLGMLPTRSNYFQHYNTAITRIDITDRDRVIIRYLNRVDHLPADMIS